MRVAVGKIEPEFDRQRGKTPWIAPDQLRQMGFSMVLYPTTVLFQMTHAIG